MESQNNPAPENNTTQNTQNTTTPPLSPVSKNTAMAVLSYIGPLVLVSYFTSKDDPFVKFHIKQGLVLLTIEVALWILSSILWMLFPIYMVIHIILIILAIIGIVNSVNGIEKNLPIVGKYAVHFKI